MEWTEEGVAPDDVVASWNGDVVRHSEDEERGGAFARLCIVVWACRLTLAPARDGSRGCLCATFGNRARPGRLSTPLQDAERAEHRRRGPGHGGRSECKACRDKPSC